MSLLVIAPQAGNDALRRRALEEARRQGFTKAVPLSWAGGCAWWFPTPGNPRGSGAVVVRDDSRFLACVGSPFWDGLTGPPLLRRLLARGHHPRQWPLQDLGGSFAMLLGGPQSVWLFTDALGLQKVHRRSDGGLLSTSFMVCRATLRQPRVRRLQAQEYVLLGANHGLASPLEGLELADPTQAHELTRGLVEPLYPAHGWRARHPYRHADEAADDLSARLGAVFADLRRAFGDDIGMALSGGFDSRLLLAGLNHAGLVPSLYVYGGIDDADVRIARETAARLGIAIECIDKTALERDCPALDAATLRHNLRFFDGLPADGVFDLGADRLTRLKQVAGGRLNLNGGGGEILRNFFYLPDRRFTAADVTQSFYANWRREAVPDAGEAQALLGATADGIARCLGLSSQAAASTRLPRSDVELVYSLFRLRWWMGRNNSLAARYGAFLTPLVQPSLVRLAADLPLAWKDYGRLEAAILRRLSPRVAAGGSAYGFSFADGPDWRHRLRVLGTVLRPVALRARSAAVRRRFDAKGAELPGRWRALAELLPAQDWLVEAELTSDDQWSRLLSLRAVASDAACGLTDADSEPTASAASEYATP